MTHVSDLVVLGEAVVVEDGEPQRLVEGVRVRKVLELELGRNNLVPVSDSNFPAKMTAHLLVEEGVEGLAVHLGLELLLPLRVRHQEHLRRGREKTYSIFSFFGLFLFVLVGLSLVTGIVLVIQELRV